MSKKKSLATTPVSSLVAAMSEAKSYDENIGSALEWLVAAEREAMPLLVTHGLTFDHGDADKVCVIDEALTRIIDTAEPGDEPTAELEKRISEAFAAEFKRTGSEALDTDVIHQRLDFQRAAFYLGVAMARTISGGGR